MPGRISFLYDDVSLDASQLRKDHMSRSELKAIKELTPSSSKKGIDSSDFRATLTTLYNQENKSVRESDLKQLENKFNFVKGVISCVTRQTFDKKPAYSKRR